MIKWNSVCVGAITVLAIAAGLDGCQRGDAEQQRVVQLIGKPIANWSLQRASASGARATLSNADLRGQKYVVVIVKADCPECRSEGSSLRTLQQEYGSRLPMVVASISGDAETAEYARITGMEHEIYLGGMPLAAKLDVRYVPVMFFVRSDGHIEHLIEGNRSLPELRAAFDAFAGGKQITVAPVVQRSLLKDVLF